MCIFCKIINGDLPCFKIYEDDDILAILDIAQVTYGHTLVLPKKHFESILDVDKETMTKIAEVLPSLTNQIITKCNAKGSHILSNTGAISGQTVDHLHFHIIPRYDENDAIVIKFNETPPQDLEAIRKQII